MKKLINVTEVDGEGLEKFLGERITIYCQIYIYTGKLIGINKDFILLESAAVVYSTGAYSDKQWADAQALPHDWYIMKNSIESFGILK